MKNKCKFKDIDKFIKYHEQFNNNDIIKENLLNLSYTNSHSKDEVHVISEKQVWKVITDDMQPANPHGKIMFSINFKEYLIDIKDEHNNKFNNILDEELK